MPGFDDDNAPLNPFAVWNWPRPILIALIVGAIPFLAVFALIALPLFMYGVGSVAITPPTPMPVPPAGSLIIIVANVSFISRDDFIADLADARGGPASEESDDIQFAAFLDDVKEIQREQVTILRDLIAEHGIKAVYLEGVTDTNLEVFHARVKELAETDAVALERQLLTEDFSKQVTAMVNLEAYERDILQTGAVGQLVMTGEVDVLPLDDEVLMDAADPTKNGWRFEGPENDAREREMVRRLLTGGPVVVAVLGQSHDLRNEIAAACQTCRLEVIAPERLDKINSVRE